MTRSSELEECFRALRKILEPYACHMLVKEDNAENYHLDTKHIMKNKKPLFFAAVNIKKNYVSFHLMPVYVNPELLGMLSEKLAGRMQGKSCFNFKSYDEALAAELTELTKVGFADYQRQGYV